MSTRKYDHNAEQEVAKFLDKYFYSVHTQNFKRETDKTQQIKGVDVICDYLNHKSIIIDEKAATSYVNIELKTFAFEINFFNRNGILNEGWLYDADKITEYYLVCWIKATKNKYFTADDITEIECYLIAKKSIINLLNNYGINKEKAEHFSKEMRENNKKVKNLEEKNVPFFFFHSSYLSESPVNVIIEKPTLKEIALETFIVKR